MAVTDEWDKVSTAFEHLKRYRVLHPTVAAMRKLVDLIKHDASFSDVHPSVSMASLMLSREHVERRVNVAWNEDGGYRATFVNSQLEFTEPTMAHEDSIVQVLRKYLDRLNEA